MNTIMQQHDQRSMMAPQQQDQQFPFSLQLQQQDFQQLPIPQQQDNIQGMFFQGMPSTKQQQTVSPRFQMNQDAVIGMSGQQMNLGNLQSANALSLQQLESLNNGMQPFGDFNDKRKFFEEESPRPLKKVRTDEPSPVPAPIPGILNMNLDFNADESTGPAPVAASKEPITFFEENDVLSGRGGGTNVHPGNRNFRDLINMHRRAYLKARKNDKPSISRAIVRAIRETGGRFLKKDEKNGYWVEIGDDAAREKTSQALRQRAPEMRKLLFDTEREEARAVAEEHLRQQRMLMGNMGNMNNMANMNNMGNMMGQGMNPVNPMANGVTMNGMANMNSSNNGMNDMQSNGMMNPALLQAMAGNKNMLSGSQTNPEISQMFSAALLQGGINRFSSNGA